MEFQGGAFTFALRRADLGRPKTVFLASFSANGDDVDYTPDDGAIAYRVPTVARANATFTGVPRSARRFGVATVDLALTDGSIARVTTRTCTATLGGKPLAPRNACSWALPKTAKGKALVVVVRSSLDGEAAPARTFRMNVR